VSDLILVFQPQITLEVPVERQKEIEEPAYSLLLRI
jgi:hypothetical protein